MMHTNMLSKIPTHVHDVQVSIQEKIEPMIYKPHITTGFPFMCQLVQTL